MYELNTLDLELINGGAGKSQPKKDKSSPEAGTLARPSNGESEDGKRLNDLAFALDAFGSWLGIKVYDMLH